MNPKPKLIETNNSAKCAYYVHNMHKKTSVLYLFVAREGFYGYIRLNKHTHLGKKAVELFLQNGNVLWLMSVQKKALKPPTPAIYFQPLC